MSIPARFSSPRIQRLAQHAATGSLGARGRRWLGRRLAASDSDRLAYHRLVELFRALEGDPLVTAAQHEAILDGALRAAGAPARPRSRGLRWLVPATALILAAVGLTLLLPPRDELQPRGSRLIQSDNEGRIGLQAFCVRRDVIVDPPPRTSDLDARCRLGDDLQLTVTLTAEYRHLLVVGTQEGGEQRYYFPVPPTGRSAPAPREAVEEPLGQAIRLEVNHRPGPLRLVAVFSRSAVEADRLFAWLATLGPTEAADRLIGRFAQNNEVTAVELHVMIEGGAR